MDANRQDLNSFHITLRGQSMWPLLREGSVYSVDPQAQVEAGDIVCLRCNETGEIIIHRYFRADTCKGDNSTCFDENICILGKVEIEYRLFPLLKAIIKFLSGHYHMRTNSVLRKILKALIITLNALTISSGRVAPASQNDL